MQERNHNQILDILEERADLEQRRQDLAADTRQFQTQAVKWFIEHEPGMLSINWNRAKHIRVGKAKA